MFGDDDLLVTKPFLKDLNGLLGRECESSNSIKCCVIEQRVQVIKLVYFGEFRV